MRVGKGRLVARRRGDVDGEGDGDEDGEVPFATLGALLRGS
jgi:hypothetical protein